MPSIVKLTLESNQYERNLRNAKKQWNDFMRGMGMSVQKFTAVGNAVAGVTAALKVAKDAFFANEKQLDDWNRTVESSKAAYNGFLNALNTGDISGFLSNISQIVSAAKEAYNALDDLNTYTAFSQVQSARSKAGYAKALDEYKVNPTAENKKALELANQAVIQNLKEQAEYTRNAYVKGLSSLDTQRLLGSENQQAFKDLFQNKSYTELLSIKSKYQEGKGGRQLYYGDRVLGSKIQNRDTGIWREMTETEKKDFELARALNQINDDQIKSVQALGAQAEQLTEAIYQQDRAFNRLAGNNGGKSGGGSKTGGGKSGKTSLGYAPDSIAAQEAEVQRLNALWNNTGASVRDQYLQPLVEAEKKLKKMRQEQELLKANAEGKFLGGHVMKSNISTESQWNPTFASKDFLNIGAGLSQEKLDAAKALVKDGNDATKSWKSAALAVQGVGSAMSAIEDPSAKIMGIIAQGIAGVAAGAGLAISAKDTTASGWAWIGAAAAITASMVAMISQIHSATGYAQGGVIKGTHYSGDMEFARVNAGETILTRAQSGVIANALEGSGMRNMQLSAVITGEQLRLVLNNNGRRTGRGEYVTTNFT